VPNVSTDVSFGLQISIVRGVIRTKVINLNFLTSLTFTHS
jgi:hypothetical protein